MLILYIFKKTILKILSLTNIITINKVLNFYDVINTIANLI